jgi:hypothetical protein
VDCIDQPGARGKPSCRRFYRYSLKRLLEAAEDCRLKLLDVEKEYKIHLRTVSDQVEPVANPGTRSFRSPHATAVRTGMPECVEKRAPKIDRDKWHRLGIEYRLDHVKPPDAEVSRRFRSRGLTVY